MTARRPASPSRCATRPPCESFALTGPTIALDARTHAFRNDLADIALAGLRLAPHYALAEASQCIAPSAMVLASPTAASPAVSQLVHGEGFLLLDRSGEWAWGRCAHDDYVGYVRVDALGPPSPAGWRVTAPAALVFDAATIKAPLVAKLPIGARVAGSEAGEFVRTADGFVHRRHLAPLAEAAADWPAAAERLVGLPYLWGGRGGGGIDCSGLVQVALGLADRPCPRDSDQQRIGLGRPIPAGALRRGDLVFSPGHVGIMLDGTRLLHANAFWMAVVIEPLADALQRLPEGTVPAYRRLDA